MRIISSGRALPSPYYDQATLLTALERVWAGQLQNPERLRQLHEHVGVAGRHLALPIEAYADLTSFGAANDAWLREGTKLGAAALADALGELDAAAIDHLFFVTVTGVATPSIDARLTNLLPLRSDVKRTPIFGLGCAAGAAAVARAADYLAGHPRQVAAVVSVELCSLTLQRDDLSVANLIASGLFGDGAAAVILAGADAQLQRPGPRVVATRSVFYPGSEELMGWRVTERGLRVLLSAALPDVIGARLRGDVVSFLEAHGLALRDVGAWVCHPGGPKILKAVIAALELSEAAVAPAWRSLRDIGNLSSASVLMILGDVLASQPPAGTVGVMLAMGPGFGCELVLLRW